MFLVQAYCIKNRNNGPAHIRVGGLDLKWKNYLILVRLFCRLFVRPRPAAKAAPEWDIDLSGMKAVYKGPIQTKGHNPFAGMTMTFYLAGDGEGGKELCGGLDTIPATAQTALDNMSTRRQKQFLRRLGSARVTVTFLAVSSSSAQSNNLGKMLILYYSWPDTSIKERKMNITS
jgi:hypothetical protein